MPSAELSKSRDRSRRSSRKGFALIGPAKRLGHGGVEDVDECGHLLLEILDRREAAATNDFAREDRKPHFDPVEPGGMFRGEMDHDAMAWVAQERLARRHRLEDAACALDAEIAGKADGLGDEAHHGFGDVDVEVVHDRMPVRGGVAAGEQLDEPLGEVHLGAGRSEAIGDLAGGDIEGSDEGQGAVTDIFELASLRPPRAHRQGRGCSLEGLHPGHFVDAARLDPGGRTLGRQAVGLADIAAFVLELRIARAVDPAADAMRLQIDLAQEATDGVGRSP